MDIVFNGKTIIVQDDIQLSAFLAERQYQTGSFAVAINGCFVPRSQYDNTKIFAGDCIEVVSAMQGG